MHLNVNKQTFFYPFSNTLRGGGSHETNRDAHRLTVSKGENFKFWPRLGY